MSHIATVLAARYQLTSRIAVGGAGEVWRAVDVTLDRPVAVKLLRREYADHPETLARFRSEARHAASLAHPGIARVFDYYDGGPQHPPFIVMELVDGPSLADVLLSERLEPDRVMGIIAQAAAALDAAHRSGLVHRDIKPANLLLTGDGVVKITDFGIAHAAGSAPVTRHGQLIGTPAYLAPERVAGHPATPASDLYSLGILAHECLTGSRPFAGTPTEIALAHGHQPLPPLPGYVSPAIATFVADLTARDPADRPASARLAAARAARLADGLAAGAAWEPGSDHPVTLADTHAPWANDLTRSVPLPARHAEDRGWPRRRVALVVGAASIAAGLIGWAVSGATSPGPAARTPPPAANTSHSALTVSVQADALVGQPVDAVVQQLRSLGLLPTVVWTQAGGQSSGYDQTSAFDQSPGRGIVTSVYPAGPVAVGSVVTVTAVPRHHGGDGGGQGNGGNGGG